MFGFRVRLVLLLGLVVGAAGVMAPRAQAQTYAVCDRALKAAEDQYLNAQYEEALRLISACLNQDNRSEEHSIAAYRLLALVHLKRDELGRAREAVVNLLGVDPTYTADPVENPPAYVSLVSVVQQKLQGQEEAPASDESQRTPFFRRTSTWLTMGGILIGSGVATYFAVGGDSGGGESTPPPSGPDPLPIPPGTP